jgi:hypothetical protein
VKQQARRHGTGLSLLVEEREGWFVLNLTLKSRGSNKQGGERERRWFVLEAVDLEAEK